MPDNDPDDTHVAADGEDGDDGNGVMPEGEEEVDERPEGEEEVDEKPDVSGPKFKRKRAGQEVLGIQDEKRVKFLERNRFILLFLLSLVMYVKCFNGLLMLQM